MLKYSSTFSLKKFSKDVFLCINREEHVWRKSEENLLKAPIFTIKRSMVCFQKEDFVQINDT
jgi:hypothetical protein